MINVGIVGGSGYTAGELIRLLLVHPKTKIDFVFSTSRAGKPVTSVHQDLLGDTNLEFSSEINPNVDVLFLCTGHGNSTKILQDFTVSPGTKIIDLSRDFRLADNNSFGNRKFIYGLPELQKSAISDADNIANPGCFATAIQLALLPAAHISALENGIHIHGITGSTGAGSSLRDTTHFSWRDNNVSIYKALDHQHVGEVTQSLTQLFPDYNSELNFVPVRGNFSRGIFISAYTESDLSLEQAQSLYEEFYADAPFVHLSEEPLHLKQVVNTNKCLLHLQKENGKLLVTCIIDNLLKGASGQALQNMNLMFKLDEKTALQLKATHF
ncbi:N-acetyl-gamma-glutamyl-phosphate reductase [Fodinibius sp. Rm-B-1B1-1]|uniref:N-acetyl-gamma-glutamyl-phosphate reductase n=1 Tax=Fodinibius alkaliphilus TaxID=3140241 RepID=UPI003159CCE0